MYSASIDEINNLYCRYTFCDAQHKDGPFKSNRGVYLMDDFATDTNYPDQPPLSIIRRTGSLRSLRTSVLVVDHSLNILSTDGVYRKIFGLPNDVQPASLQEAIAARIELGWHGLAEAVDDSEAPVEARLSEIRAQVSRQTYICSTSGEIVSVSHYTDTTSGNTFLFISESEFCSSSLDPQTNQLLPFHIVLNLDTLSRSEKDLHTHASEVSDPIFLADGIFSNSGELRYLNVGNVMKLPRHPIQDLSDLDISVEDVHDILNEHGAFTSINSSLFYDFDVLVKITSESIYEEGPSFLKCSVEELGARLSPGRIAALFPQFTNREVEIVLLLAQGHNLKEVARIADRAQGTVTIQARSAMQKSGTRSLVALVSLVCQMCL